MNKNKEVIIKIDKGGCYIENFNNEIKNKILEDLSFDNPMYLNALKHGNYVNSSISRFLIYCSINSDGTVIKTPRGYIWILKKWLKKNKIKSKVIDNTLLLPKIEVSFKGKLRDYQEKAVNDVTSRYPIGLLEAVTGCLTGDTLIRLNRGGKGFQCTLQHGYEKFNQTGIGQGKNWDKSIPTFIRSYNHHENQILLNEIDDIVYSGVKKVYMFTLEDGKILKGTLDHKILTSKGWKKLGELKQYEKVMVDTLKLHASHTKRNFGQGIPKYKKVVKKEYLGELPTYDICCKNPYNNFTANDIVVHNSGKTVIAIAIIAKRKQPTLIIVHNKELLYQWQNSIKKFLDYDCGLVGDGKLNIKKITVGIINSVKNKVDILKNEFGQIIIDESHRAPSTTWTETLCQFPAKHYLGLSATPYRRDGLGDVIYIHIGPKLHKVDKKELHSIGAVLKPQIILIKTPYKYGRNWADEQYANYSSIIKNLTEDIERNNLIVNYITEDLKKNNENILVVSDRVQHCKELQRLLDSKRIKSELLHGSISKKEREEIVNRVKSGKVKILISTLSLIGEGFDAPNLSVLFLTTPIKFKGRVIQSVGRILRPSENKVPRLYDIRDDNVTVLRYSGFSRNKIYKDEGWG